MEIFRRGEINWELNVSSSERLVWCLMMLACEVYIKYTSVTDGSDKCYVCLCMSCVNKWVMSKYFLRAFSFFICSYVLTLHWSCHSISTKVVGHFVGQLIIKREMNRYAWCSKTMYVWVCRTTYSNSVFGCGCWLWWFFEYQLNLLYLHYPEREVELNPRKNNN